MLDLTGLPALDVAIGLAFIFFLLATLAMTIQEFVAAALGLRARTLEQGLRSMLEDPEKGWKHVDEFYAHPLIRSLYRTPPPAAIRHAAASANGAARAAARPGDDAKPSAEPDALGKNAGTQAWGRLRQARAFFTRTSGPSYLSPRSFALVLLDNLAPADGQQTLLEKGSTALDGLPAGLRQRLKPLVDGAGNDVETLRANLEAWYDDTMARVSGWYKRKTQIIVIVIGVILVPAINANAIVMAERMWKDDAVRSAILVQAGAQASASPAAEGQAATADERLSNAADSIDKVDQVGMPLGWTGAAVPDGDVAGIATMIAGWLLTILAISLGAPFWFDTLSRVSRLRSSGKPETPLPASGSGKPNERILTPPRGAGAVAEPDGARPATPAAGDRRSAGEPPDR